MTLQRVLYDVALNTPDGVVVHQVAPTSGDKMRAELEAPKHKLTDTGAYNSTSLNLWAALVREGLVSVGYQEFRNEVLEEFDVVKDANNKPLMVTVDPTQPATGAGSPSSSRATSAGARRTGSTRTSKKAS